MNWASRLQAPLGPFEPGSGDLRLDAAFDLLNASSLLSAAGLAAQQNVLAERLVEAAASLARVASAVAPADRPAWGGQMHATLSAGLDSPVLALESAVAQIAVAWAASSSFPTDVIFSARPDLLVVLQGFQSDPLTDALLAAWTGSTMALSLPAVSDHGHIDLHAAADAEDEAQQAAACVLARLAQGLQPVALVAQDRVLTRRVRAMLARRGVAMRDETGWKLSTTRAAACVMGLLRAAVWDASTDAVLDWAKNAPAFSDASVTAAEIELRKAGVRLWRSVGPSLEAASALSDPATAILKLLQRSRKLATWLHDLRTALRAAGQWEGLAADEAGQPVLEALHLDDGRESDLAPVDVQMDLHDFTAWVSQTLEAASFLPLHPPVAQVVILPLPQLLGRSMQAVVLPGADEVRLPASPEPTGLWTPQQRLALGLQARSELAAAQRAAWDYALQFGVVDVLWRTSEAGERLMPSSYVQMLLLDPLRLHAADPRAMRMIRATPLQAPMPVGSRLPVTKLSASAYEDLRRCPYRYFALRQLKLQASDELETELGKRDFGNWLHTLLSHFHEDLQASPTNDLGTRICMINSSAQRATRELALSDDEFLPFAAAWPRVRDGYLVWLAGHEAEGARFEEAEQWKETPLGRITLVGKIDRIDRLPDGQAMLIDYKTENSKVTGDRIKDGREDTQLAFYAALIPDDTLAAAYVNVGEKEPTRTHQQHDIVALRDELCESIVNDFSRITAGAPLPALGEGQACTYCAARGLCRRDFREGA